VKKKLKLFAKPNAAATKADIFFVDFTGKE
jgi:hypothetical protein